VREKLDHSRREFEQLLRDGKLPVEATALIKGLMMLVEVLVAIFLERTTKKNNKNSSKPSSQTEKDESAKAVEGSNSRGKGESGERFSGSRTKESTRVSVVQICDVCGEDLSETPCDGHERRTKIDIVFEKVVEHIDAEIKTCPNCESEVKGRFPEDMPGPLQYGNGLKAYLINLVISQMIALGRIQKMITTLIGVTIAESSIIKYVLQLYNALENWEKSAKAAIEQSPLINCDETSLRAEKKNYWVHVYSSGIVTLKFLHRKRGTEAVEDIGIIPRYGGVIVHDCWASYFSYKNCQHALCGSHLLRELAFIIESNNYRWARCMKRLLQETCQKVSKSKRKKLSSEQYANLVKRYRNIITRGENEMPQVLARADGQRGRIAKSDAHNLLERLKAHEEAVLMFAKVSYVPFTNNRAERDLRMGKVKQKVSGCFRSELLAEAYCRISSYLTTMANRGFNPLIAIQMALAGQAPLEGGE
jgi:transposase